LWLKEIAPSDALRKWFAHDPKRWTEFKARYRKELSGKKYLMLQLRKLVAEHNNITLLYGARDQVHNEAAALLSFVKPARSS
jgi:uncharacterized protein YeaO (DUF488 family)